MARLEDVLPLLACPDDKAPLSRAGQTLVCELCGIAWPLRNGIPVFLSCNSEEAARRGTQLYEGTAEYFERLHRKRVHEWRAAPFMSETFMPQEGWALDVGSGAGTFTLQNARRGLATIGLEISFHGADHGRRLAERMNIPNAFFVVGDAARLPFREGAFYLATNYTVIEHLYAPEACVREMARALRPGGRLFLHTLNHFSIHPEAGWPTLSEFFHELGRYLRARVMGAPAWPLEAPDPKTITRERWISGEDMDIYHAASYELLDICRAVLRVEDYATFSYPADGTQMLLNDDLTLAPQRLAAGRRILYRFLRLFNHLPVLKHMGKTLSILAEKRNART